MSENATGDASPVVACVDWVDLSPEIDPLHATVTTDVRRFGFSESDRAAVETALRLGAAWSAPVWVVSVAPPAAGPALAELAASGADRVVRIDGVDPAGASLGRIGAALADVCTGASAVVCGDCGLTTGSGAVPSFVAHHLGVAQALGVVSVEVDEAGPSGRAVRVVRRLDGGRREHVRLASPCVVSTEGSVARLRRAPLERLSDPMPVEVVPAGPAPTEHEPVVVATTAWRPRPRELPPPSADDPLQRIIALTGALVARTPPRRVELEPPAAADAILDQLREWGYLSP